MKPEEPKQSMLTDQQARQAHFCLDHAPFSFFRCNPKGRLAFANRKACESLGYSLDELLQMTVFEFCSAFTSRNWADNWQKMSDRGPITVETVHRRKDGTLFPVEIAADIAEYEGLKFAMLFVQDITDRKRMQEAQRLTQFSFDKAAIGIFRSGSDARILNVNEQGCRSLGYSHEELRKKTIFDIDASLSVEERNNLWDKLCDRGVISFESIHRRKDGTTFPVEITANLLEFEGKNYSMTFVRDITAQKDDEKQKAAIEDHLQQAQRMEALGTLAGGIAHDFNNILSAIIGYAELAKNSCKENPKAQEYIHQLGVAGNRAKDLVRHILAFSRQSTSEKKPIDISKVIKEALTLIRPTIPLTIQIRQNIPENLGTIFADETQIHQIVMNLCTNAYQAMHKEGGLLEVHLVPADISFQDSLSFPDIRPGRYLKLIVSDIGHGMDPDTLARIFDPYFTTKEAGQGTGMGLSTVHGIVKDHGGAIKVYSEPGEGATFQIFFPLADAITDHTSKVEEPSPRGTECVFFIDDEEFLIEIGKDLLTSLGYQVETRTSAADAIKAFRSTPEKYDLVISDMTMPKMSGEQLAMKIKRIRPDIPIIISTGFSTKIDADTLSKIGVSRVLLKPFTLNDLANTVRDVLNGESDPAGNLFSQ